MCDYGGNIQKLCNKQLCDTCLERSFASHEKSKYWSKRNILKPRQVFKNSHTEYWFDCNICTHEFDISLNEVNGRNGWCPYCASKKLCDDKNCNICFNKSFASSEKSKYWSKRNILKPRQVFKGSSIKYWFDCCDCVHKFDITLNHVKENKWCPYCSNKKLCDDENCITCFEKSLASFNKIKFWSEKNILKPRHLFKNNHAKFWFNCDVCLHEFDIGLNSLSRGRWCPYCSSPPQKFCINENCIACLNKSFASSEKSKYWSDKNNLSPEQLFLSSQNKCWFLCKTCDHEFLSSLTHISNMDSWCPYCASKKLCDDENCITCLNKSFASCALSNSWSLKNLIKPREIFKNCMDLFYFDCKNCNNEFKTKPNSITSSLSGCPHCVNKTETKLYEFLKSIYSNCKRQLKLDTVKSKTTNKHYPFDFAISQKIIELDGAQHFKQVSNWQSPEIAMKRDCFKMKYATRENFHVLRLLQEDVFFDKIDWKSIIQEFIKQEFENPTIVFTSKLYRDHADNLKCDANVEFNFLEI